MDDLNKATVADVREFHGTYYVPNNATLVAVGDFDAAELTKLAAKHFGSIPRGKQPPPVTATEPPQKALREVSREYPNAPLDAVVSAYHLPPQGHPDSYALEIASNILSAGQSSRLYRRLVYEEQSAMAAQGQALLLEGPGIFFGFALANQGKNIKEVSSSLQFVFDEMRKKPVAADELEKAKNQVVAGFITGRETMQAKADFLGRCAVLLRNPELFNSELAKYQAVTAADVQRVVAKYLVPANETRLFIKPKPQAAKQ
jgi:zinc protease